MSLRLGWDLDKALDPVDGVGHYCHQLLRALMALDSENDYTLFQPHGQATQQDLERNFGSIPANFRLASPTRRGPDGADFDLVHSTTWVFPFGFDGPVLFTCYDLTFLSHAHFHTLENRLACLTGTLRAHLRGGHFLAISEATAHELERRLGVGTERIDVIYPAPAERFRPLTLQSSEPPPTDRFGLPACFILAVGTLEPRKNLSRLIEAYRGLDLSERRQCSLVIAGGGGWKQDDLAERFGELEGLRWLGRVNDDDLVLLYNRATLFAYPSLAEGFGLPIVEAMSCGTPVLTSDRSAMAEVAGEAAVLVDPTDTESIRRGLSRLLRDEELRHELATHGLAHAGSFSWHRTAEEVLALYQRLAGAAP